jgi:hypothetical protein
VGAGYTTLEGKRICRHRRRDLFSPAATFRSHKLCKVVAKKRAPETRQLLFIFNGARMERENGFESAYFWDKKKMVRFGVTPITLYSQFLSFFH